MIEYFSSGALVTILIVSMGTIIENLLQMYPIMASADVHTWHNHMYVHCTLIVPLLTHLQ
jgi:hypothetical protein